MRGIKVMALRLPSREEIALVTEAAKITMQRGYVPDGSRGLSRGILANLMQFGHTSQLEHADMSFFVEGASRVFLAQITRHRLLSPTSGSQQYQLHHGFEYIDPGIPDGALLLRYREHMQLADELYRDLEGAVGRDQARYVLPGACRNNLVLKGNLREWFCNVVPLRACRRNTVETCYVVSRVLKSCINDGPPELGQFVSLSGPACLTKGACDQGKLCCGRPMRDWTDMLSVRGVDYDHDKPAAT